MSDHSWWSSSYVKKLFNKCAKTIRESADLIKSYFVPCQIERERERERERDERTNELILGQFHLITYVPPAKSDT